MDDRLGLKKYIRTVNNFPIDGIIFRDITSLIETPEAFVKTCDELGFIKFGSRVDLFLPENTKLNIKLNDKVIGGKTVIAKY